MEVSKYLEEILHSHEKFFTVQRRMILEEIAHRNDHPTAESIYHAVQIRLPHISLGTVYRNLQLMQELDIIHKHTFSGQDQARYEIAKEPHYHAVCTLCHAVADMPEFRSVTLEPSAKEITGYYPLSHEVAVYGVCPSCQKDYD